MCWECVMSLVRLSFSHGTWLLTDAILNASAFHACRIIRFAPVHVYIYYTHTHPHARSVPSSFSFASLTLYVGIARISSKNTFFSSLSVHCQSRNNMRSIIMKHKKKLYFEYPSIQWIFILCSFVFVKANQKWSFPPSHCPCQMKYHLCVQLPSPIIISYMLIELVYLLNNNR